MHRILKALESNIFLLYWVSGKSHHFILFWPPICLFSFSFLLFYCMHFKRFFKSSCWNWKLRWRIGREQGGTSVERKENESRDFHYGQETLFNNFLHYGFWNCLFPAFFWFLISENFTSAHLSPQKFIWKNMFFLDSHILW